MWYVLQVASGKELSVAAKLREKEFGAMVPQESRLLRSGGAWSEKEYLLFPGYVFLNAVYSAAVYYAVKKVEGVLRFLGDQGGPTPLSYLEVEWIRILSGDGAVRPSVVRKTDGGTEVVSGVLRRFEPGQYRVNFRARKAELTITVCGEEKKIQLSVRPEGEEEAAPEEGAEEETEQDS